MGFSVHFVKSIARTDFILKKKTNLISFGKFLYLVSFFGVNIFQTVSSTVLNCFVNTIVVIYWAWFYHDLFYWIKHLSQQAGRSYSILCYQHIFSGLSTHYIQWQVKPGSKKRSESKKPNHFLLFPLLWGCGQSVS